MAIESLFNSMDISASGLTAQRRRLDLIANNLANAGTTRTAEGGPYRRKDVTFKERLDAETGREAGVEINQIVTDKSAPRRVYDPTHPDADTEGYVSLPNVSTLTEMVNMIQVTRLYEANVTAMNAAKEMINKSFDILSR